MYKYSFFALFLSPVKPFSQDFCTFFSTIHDVHEHSLPDQSMLINEMAAAAGFQNKLDPLLMQCIQGLPKQVHNYFHFRQLNYYVCFENLREIENDPIFLITGT